MGSASGIRLNCGPAFLVNVYALGFLSPTITSSHDIKSNYSNSGYSNHILNTGHTYGTIEDTMEIITTGRKGKYLNTLEK
jgi:hypothetical protein